MPTPQIVAESALRFVRMLNLPATNWPNIQNVDHLRTEQNNHKIIAARQSDLVDAFGEFTLKAKQAMPGWFGNHTLLPRPDLTQALKMGNYYATIRSCTSLNCGERACVVFWFAHESKNKSVPCTCTLTIMIG